MSRRWIPGTIGPVVLAAAFVPAVLIFSALAVDHPQPARIDRPPPGPVSGAAVAATVQRAIGASGTVTIVPSYPDPASTLAWPAFVEYTPQQIAFSISVDQIPADTQEGLLVDPRYQSYKDGELCMAAKRDALNRPWLCAKDGATDEFAALVDQTLPFRRASYDPYSIVRLLKRATTVEVVPSTPDEGPTVHYRAVLAADRFLVLATPQTTVQAAALKKGRLEQQVDLLLDAAGRPTQATVQVPAIGLTQVEAYDRWGGAGLVVAPPRDRVIDSSELKALGISLVPPKPTTTATPAPSTTTGPSPSATATAGPVGPPIPTTSPTGR